MIQIRSNVFETNSSSTHSICIPKKTKTIVSHVNFMLGDFGWENDTVYDTASYLYTAILCGYNYDEAMEKLNRLTDILNRHNIAYKFEKPKWEYDKYNGTKYLSWESGYIDHPRETNDLVESLLDDEDMLLRYLSEGVVYTGNDNEDNDGRCTVALEYHYVREDGAKFPNGGSYDDMMNYFHSGDWVHKKVGNWENPYYDPDNFDYFYKGN